MPLEVLATAGVGIRIWMPQSVLLPADVPGLLPDLTATVVVCFVIAGVTAPGLAVSRPRLAVWLLALALPVAYTWSAATAPAPFGCSSGTFFWQGLSIGVPVEVWSNVVLLMPAGAAVFLWPRGVRRLTALVVACCIPPVLELGQLAMHWLNRTCQYGDIVNNVLGVFVGFCAIAGALELRRLLREALARQASGGDARPSERTLTRNPRQDETGPRSGPQPPLASRPPLGE